MKDKGRGTDANRDPITGAPGSHPLGTGAGAASAGATGAAIGAAVGGPIGAVVGGAAGAIAGGLAGHSIAEGIDPTVEDAYWRKSYGSRPYVTKGASYDDYRPAYQYGWESRARYEGRDWDEVESDLARDWDKAKGKTRLKWEEAKHAARDAWHRITPEDRIR